MRAKNKHLKQGNIQYSISVIIFALLPSLPPFLPFFLFQNWNKENWRTGLPNKTLQFLWYFRYLRSQLPHPGHKPGCSLQVSCWSYNHLLDLLLPLSPLLYALLAITLLYNMNPKYMKSDCVFYQVLDWNKAEASCSVSLCWSASLLLKRVFEMLALFIPIWN